MAKGSSNLPTPVLYKSVFQVRYKPELRFYELRDKAAGALTEFPHWTTDRHKTTVYDPTKRCSVVIAHDAFSYSQDLGNTQNEGLYVDRVADVLPETLERRKFTRFGLRRWYLIPVTFSFESLVTVLDVKLNSQDDEFRSIIPRKTDDLMSVIVSSGDGFSARTVIGPLKKVEIPANIQYDQEHHLPAETKAESYVDVLRQYPDVSVYLDIDYFQLSNESKLTDIRSFVSAARKEVSGMVVRLNEYFFSSRVKP